MASLWTSSRHQPPTTPVAYDAGNYSATVHVHFDTASTSSVTEDFVGIAITEPTATYHLRQVIMVSPAGYVCYQSNTAYCLPPYPLNTIPASSDYDIDVTVLGNGTAFSAGYQPGAGIYGGLMGGGLTGLIEVNGSGTTVVAYFTNYTFYQYK